MEEIIRDMLREANTPVSELLYREEKRKLLEFAKRIVDELANTHNAPSNWREIGATLAREWNNGTWEHDTSYENGSMFDILELGSYGANECFGGDYVGEVGEDHA